MIRLTNLKLALDHSEDDLKDIILFTLKIRAEQLLDFTVFRRGIDARKKRNILLLYTIDVQTTEEEALLTTFSDDQSIRLTPDMAYKFVTKAPEELGSRPVVIGFWSLWIICRFSAGANGL